VFARGVRVSQFGPGAHPHNREAGAARTSGLGLAFRRRVGGRSGFVVFIETGLKFVHQASKFRDLVVRGGASRSRTGCGEA
jgi:hypothetical protein